MKKCTKCQNEHPLTGFHRGNNPDGYRTWCKICVAEYKKQYVAKNGSRIREQQKQYSRDTYPLRRGYYEQRYLENKETLTKNARLHRMANLEAYANRERQRRAAIKQRTPAWLTEDDHWMIEQAHELAALRTKTFGFDWHVDHIIPLRGKTVSGLNVPWNLQVIPGVVNIKKGNKIVEVQL